MSSSTTNSRHHHILSTMSFLSLCTDSGHPPGLLTNQNTSPGTIKQTGSHSHDKWQCNAIPQHDRRLVSDVTTYYTSSDTSYPSTNPTPFSLSHLHVISMLTSQLLSQFSWLLVYYILSSWLQISLFLFLSVILLFLPLPPINDHLDWQQNDAPTPSNIQLHYPTLLGNLAIDFIWIPGYYLLSYWPWIFYFLIIFHLPWLIPLPPEDTLVKHYPDCNPTHTNQSYPICCNCYRLFTSLHMNKVPANHT